MVNKKIAIYIPTYNAAQTLPIVLDRIPEELKRSVQEIFIVDNAIRDAFPPEQLRRGVNFFLAQSVPLFLNSNVLYGNRFRPFVPPS